MSPTIERSEFLGDLHARNDLIRYQVEKEFMPLEPAARSAQPAPGEWCVDQCFQHLFLAFELNLTQVLRALDRPPPAELPPLFKPSWVARQALYRRGFDPRTRIKTLPIVTPSDHYYPDVFERFLAQKARMSDLLVQAAKADLQQRCWYLKVLPINVGDYLEQFVLHDELHVDQAQRALAAYQESLPAQSGEPEQP